MARKQTQKAAETAHVVGAEGGTPSDAAATLAASSEIEALINDELRNDQGNAEPTPIDGITPLETAAAQAETETEGLPPADTLENALTQAADAAPETTASETADEAATASDAPMTDTENPFFASTADVEAPATTDEPNGYVPPGTPEAEVAKAEAAANLGGSDEIDDLAGLGKTSRTKMFIAIGAVAVLVMAAIGFLAASVRPKDVDTALPAATETTAPVAPAPPTATVADGETTLDLAGCTLSDFKVEGNDLVVGDCVKRVTVK